jgi:hypothetical protein
MAKKIINIEEIINEIMAYHQNENNQYHRNENNEMAKRNING